jgi:hypothetical protein
MSRLQRLRDPVFLLVGPAVAWGILLLVLAGTVPVVTPQSPPGTGSAAVTSSGTVVTTTTPSSGPTVSGQARITLVRDSGYRVLGLVALPTVTALIVGLLLWRQARIRTASVGSTTTSVAAWVLSAVVLLAGIVGFVTIVIGFAVVPIGVLLLLACTQAAVSGGSGSAPGRRAAPSGVGA